MRSSIYQNLGFEELSYEEVLNLSSVPITFRLSKYDKFIPRKLFPRYIPNINYFRSSHDNLFFCMCFDLEFNIDGMVKNKRVFISPSNVLIATLMREDESGIKDLLGINDDISTLDINKINEIIRYLKGGEDLFIQKMRLRESGLSRGEIIRLLGNKYAFQFIIRKRLNNILSPMSLSKLTYKGNALGSIAISKNGVDKYRCELKREISYYYHNNQYFIKVPFSFNCECDCGLNKASHQKYEFEIVDIMCPHLEMIRQSLSFFNNNQSTREIVDLRDRSRHSFLGNILSVFSPLDRPMLEDNRLRTIIREALYNYIVPQKYLRTYYDDSKKYHKNNGYTLFRCELDALLMSYKEIYNPIFLREFIDHHNNRLSELYTAKYFGDYINYNGEYLRVNAIHFKDKFGKIDHLIDHKWRKIFHYAKELSTNRIGELQSFQFTHNSRYEHIIIDNSLVPSNYEVFHVIKKYRPIMNYEQPFMVSKIGNILIYPTSYKLRKSHN